MDKRVISVLTVIVVLMVGVLGAQVVSVNNKLNDEKAYSKKLEAIDKEMFVLNSKAFTALSNSGACGVQQDTACLQNITAQVNDINAQFGKKVTERNTLKDNHDK